MHEVLLGEILENQIGINALFHFKKVVKAAMLRRFFDHKSTAKTRFGAAAIRSRLKRLSSIIIVFDYLQVHLIVSLVRCCHFLLVALAERT